jgi:hypothetical protein
MDIRETGYMRGLDLSETGQRPLTGSCDRDNEYSGSIQGTESLDQLSD